MQEPSARPDPRSPWLVLGAWVLLIFVTAPLARTVQGWVAARWGRGAFGVAVVAAVLAGAALAGTTLARRGLLRGTRILWLGGVAAVFVGFTAELRSRPEEAIHFVEYGVLGLLAFGALRRAAPDASVYAAAALLAGAVGVIDEALQWATPGRVWDLRDIGRNALAGALVQVAIARGIRPAGIARRPSARGLRRALRLAIAGVGLLGASLLLTPERIGWGSERIPGLGGLAYRASPMFEYGHLYDDPRIGRFRSRFARDALAREDRARGAEAGAILARSGDDASYAEFLRRYTPVTDPFLHEVRVHLFSRDYHVRAAEEAGDDRDRRRLHASIAHRENRILELYFPRTLASSGLALDPERRTWIEAESLPDLDWESWVSRDLATTVRERHVVAGLGIVLASLALLERMAARRVRRAG